MNIIDFTYFGYGAGLVIIAWVAGMCVSAVLRVFKHV
jgi:hypothetical protein